MCRIFDIMIVDFIDYLIYNGLIMKKYIAYIVLVVIALGSVIFLVKNNNTGTKDNSPIVIGTILSQTGVASAFGESAKNGVILAVEEINAHGGIDGRKITVIHEDDHTDPKTAIGSYKKLTSIDNVDVIIGSNFDFMVKTLFLEAEKSGTPVITPTSPRIAGSTDTNKNSFTMLSDFSEIIYSLNGYLTKTPYTKVAVIYYDGPFGEEITKTISSISVKNGKGVALAETYNSFGIKDWTPYILKMKKEGVDMVFADMLGNDYAKFVEQSKRYDFTPKMITHMDIKEVLDDKQNDHSYLNGTIVLNWDVLGDDEKFNALFKKRFGKDATHFAAQAYTSVYIASKAIAEADTKEEVVSILEKRTFDTPLGKFEFTKNHTGEITKVKVQEIRDGALVDIKVK